MDLFKSQSKLLLPPYKSLPKVAFCVINVDVRELLQDARPEIRNACTKMVAYASLLFGNMPQEVSLQQLLCPEIAQAFIEYGRQKEKVLSHTRRVYQYLGRPDLIPIINRKYPPAHPLLLAWLATRRYNKIKEVGVRGVCMSFLVWMQENVLPQSHPSEMPLVMIQRAHLVKFRRSLVQSVHQRQRSYDTARWRMQLVVRWIRWLIDEGKVAPIDLSGLAIRSSESSQERRIPTHTQVSKFMSTVFLRKMDADFKVYFLLLLATGARPVELKKLTMELVDKEQHAVYLQSKDGPGRWMPLPPNVWDVLQRHIDRRSRQANDAPLYVLQGRTGNPLNNAVVHKHFSNVKFAAGVDIDGQMAFRHRLATDCYEAKVPIRVFQKIMGHRGVSEQKRYQHSSIYRQRKEIESAFRRIGESESTL